MSENWRMLHFTHFLGHLLLFSHQSLDNRNHQHPPWGAAAVVNTNKMSQHSTERTCQDIKSIHIHVKQLRGKLLKPCFKQILLPWTLKELSFHWWGEVHYTTFKQLAELKSVIDILWCCHRKCVAQMAAWQFKEGSNTAVLSSKNYTLDIYDLGFAWLWFGSISHKSNVSSLMVYSRQRLYGHWSGAWYPCHDKFTGVQWPTNKKLSPTLNSTKCQSSHVIWFATMNVNLLPRSTSKLETHLDLISSNM